VEGRLDVEDGFDDVAAGLRAGGGQKLVSDTIYFLPFGWGY